MPYVPVKGNTTSTSGAAGADAGDELAVDVAEAGEPGGEGQDPRRRMNEDAPPVGEGTHRQRRRGSRRQQDGSGEGRG